MLVKCAKFVDGIMMRREQISKTSSIWKTMELKQNIWLLRFRQWHRHPIQQLQQVNLSIFSRKRKACHALFYDISNQAIFGSWPTYGLTIYDLYTMRQNLNSCGQRLFTEYWLSAGIYYSCTDLGFLESKSGPEPLTWNPDPYPNPEPTLLTDSESEKIRLLHSARTSWTQDLRSWSGSWSFFKLKSRVLIYSGFFKSRSCTTLVYIKKGDALTWVHSTKYKFIKMSSETFLISIVVL